MTYPRPRTRFSLSIGQGMVLVLIVSLCLAPVITAARDPRAGRILGAVVLDIVVVPTVASIVLMVLVEPGPIRDWYIKAFWLTPLVFLGLILTLSVPAIILSAHWSP